MKPALSRPGRGGVSRLGAGGLGALALMLLTLPLPGQAQVPSGTGLRESPAKLLADAPRSGAVTMMPGETYYGPGPLTVGYLGAKKQLVLPNGAWVLLAAVDRHSVHPTPVPLVSMVFGQFREGKLAALMSYLFTGRTVAGKPGWADAQTCHNKLPNPSAQRVEANAHGATGCGWTVHQARMVQVQDAGWDAALAATARLGAPTPVPPLMYTRTWAVDATGNYLATRRADFAPIGDPAAAQAARAAWLQEYLPLMLEGFDKKIGATELEPDQPKLPAVRVALPD